MNPLLALVSVEAGHSAGVEVRFEFPRTGEIVNLPLPDRRALEMMRRKAGVYLQQTVEVAPRLRTGWDEAAGAFATLINRGWALANELAQHYPPRILQLQAAFVRAWPAWQGAAWSDPAAPLPLVEIRCHDETIPIELLPVFDFGNLPELRTHDDLVRAASRFLGFAAVVKRVTPARLPTDRVLRNRPALPVQFIRHRNLASTAGEQEYLSSLDGHVVVDGPWPTTQSDEQVPEMLSQALFDGSRFDGGTTAGPPIQIQHFACHCDTTTEFDDDYALTLSTRSGKERRVTFAQLREAHRKRFFPDADVLRERAVVLMNACGSSRTNPLTAFSLPRWFLNCGHRAFIGTEAAVPDDVAQAFATAFYGRLLERRRPIGEAVVLARRDLLRDYRNPLGLLYVMYGATDLTVEQARPGVYRASA